MNAYAICVRRCARYILTDLVGSDARPLSLSELSDLCARHGGPPLFDRGASAGSALCVGAEILLSARSSLQQYREAALHELVHRLAETERWEPLNPYVRRFSHRRREFIEALATRVGSDFAAQSQRSCGPVARERSIV